MVENRENDCRQNDAARCRNARQHAVGPACELPVQHLALDFQSHQQKEYCHQRIVDPVRKAERADI